MKTFNRELSAILAVILFFFASIPLLTNMQQNDQLDSFYDVFLNMCRGEYAIAIKCLIGFLLYLAVTIFLKKLQGWFSCKNATELIYMIPTSVLIGLFLWPFALLIILVFLLIEAFKIMT